MDIKIKSIKMDKIGKEYEVKVTGYYPSDDEIEGGFEDCKGHPLKTLLDYKRGSSNNSHVSLAVDPEVIPLGCLVNIEKFNDKDNVPILFYACDTGGSVKGKHVDVCCGNKKQAFDIDSDGETRTLKIIGFQELN